MPRIKLRIAMAQHVNAAGRACDGSRQEESRKITLGPHVMRGL